MGKHKPTETGDVAQTSTTVDLRPLTARLRPHDREEAEQEARLRLLQVSARQGVGNPLHLMRRIARNLVIDHLRHQKRTHPLPSESTLEQGFTCPRPDPEQSLIANERLQNALSVIDQMPLRRREAFLLHRINGLSYTQIARKMGVTPKAVEKHMALAMLNLARGMVEIEKPKVG